MSDILFNVQQAVFDALAANPAVQAVLGPSPALYDYVAPGAEFPYIVYGPVHAESYDAKAESGFEQIVTLNIWSRYRGGKEAKEIFQAVYDALHRANLSVAGQTFVLSEFHSADFSLDEDGQTYHAAVRFTIVTQGD